MTRNTVTEFISEAERAQLRRLLNKGIAPSLAQSAALLNEIDRLQGRRSMAAEPEAKAFAPCATCGGVRLVRSSAGDIYDIGKPCPACRP
jgi:hypothetical protein